MMQESALFCRLGFLGAVFAAALLAVHAGGIECPADDMIAHARQIFHAAAADHDDRVFLKIMPFARDIRRDFHTVRQAHARDLAESGVRLLRRRRRHLDAHAALERAVVEGVAILDAIDRVGHRRGFRLARGRCARLFDQLIDGGHRDERLKTYENILEQKTNKKA